MNRIKGFKLLCRAIPVRFRADILHIRCGTDGIAKMPLSSVFRVGRTVILIDELQAYRQSRKTVLQAAPAMLFPGRGKPSKTSDLQRYLPRSDGIRPYPLDRHANGT